VKIAVRAKPVVAGQAFVVDPNTSQVLSIEHRLLREIPWVEASASARVGSGLPARAVTLAGQTLEPQQPSGKEEQCASELPRWC
jgi:hypothetical protein